MVSQKKHGRDQFDLLIVFMLPHKNKKPTQKKVGLLVPGGDIGEPWQTAGVIFWL
ncbi:hypothetical protein GCD22_01636 [Acidithiobacillus thiooxidans ATCC 19377]|uniref:Uncharacterized protein n=1 Tax=Acidithiobacillus thiooxidans ATCC 19377 TaxID=637390 RepID=A0A5P9XQN3_ACITH|nr:hypothetical protein GCD22_01636 [Acidithiobacillus thiooxidans ATCC 19377]